MFKGMKTSVEQGSRNKLGAQNAKYYMKCSIHAATCFDIASVHSMGLHVSTFKVFIQWDYMLRCLKCSFSVATCFDV
jgi:hypothetical protein